MMNYDELYEYNYNERFTTSTILFSSSNVPCSLKKQCLSTMDRVSITTTFYLILIIACFWLVSGTFPKIYIEGMTKRFLVKAKFLQKLYVINLLSTPRTFLIL